MDKITVDKNGIIGQIEPGGTIDGGDSVNWRSHQIYLDGAEVGNFFKYFHDGHLGFVRHPDNKEQHAYYKNPWQANITRDQSKGIMAAIIKDKNTWEAIKFIYAHMLRLFLVSHSTVDNNDLSYKFKFPDPTFADVWAMEIRLIKPLAWLLWPLLNILDLWMLISTIYYNYVDSKDPISFAITSIVQREHTPTLTSLLSWKLLDKKKLEREIFVYWAGWRENEGMYYLYKKRIEALK